MTSTTYSRLIAYDVIVCDKLEPGTVARYKGQEESTYGMIISVTADEVMVLWSQEPNCLDFSKFAFPLVRRVFNPLIMQDLVSVQPMTLPAGLTFYLDHQTSGSTGNS